MAITVISTLGFAVTAEGCLTASIWQILQGIGLVGTYMPGLILLTDIVPESVKSRAVALVRSTFLRRCGFIIIFWNKSNWNY